MSTTPDRGGDLPPEPKLRLYEPDGAEDYDGAAMAPNSTTVWQVIHARIENLSLRVQSGTFSKDAFENIRKGLIRFGNAWSVHLDGGRQFLIPVAENRQVPLKISAADEVGAVEQAGKLAGIPGPAICKRPVVHHGDKVLDECSGDDLTRWLVVNPQWESGHTKRNNLIAIVECFGWFKEEYDVKVAYKRKHIPKFVRQSRREATDTEYIALMKNGCRALRRVLWCHYNLVGIRPAEVRGMLWSDFNWDGAFVLTFVHKTARETNKPRLFALTGRQFRFFANLYKQRPPENDFVFLNTDGNAWNRRALGQNLRRLAERIGLDDNVAKTVSVGCFRQTFATQTDEAGMLDQEIAMLLGHQDTKMLKAVYSKASKKVRHVRQASEKAERLRREERKRNAKDKAE